MPQTETVEAPATDAYWRARLAGLGDASCFPTDLRPAGETGEAGEAGEAGKVGEAGEAGQRARTGEHTVPLPPPLTERLDRLSRHQPATLHLVLCAALMALLHRYRAPSTDGDEIVIGVPTSGTANPALVLAAAPTGTFRELLTRLRDEVRQAVRHQDYPVLRLAEELGRGAAFDVAMRLDGLHDHGFAGAVPVRMLFTAGRTVSGLHVTVRYDARRHTAAMVRRIAEHYARLLELATAEPDRPLAELDLRTGEDERRLAASNATARGFDTEATVHGLFERQAAATPDNPALLTGDTTVSFAELDARANRLARTLRERGVHPDQPVGVLAERSVELVVAILAVLKAGGAYLPIDPGYPRARIGHLLADSGARLAVAQARFAELAAANAAGVDVVDLDDAALHAANPSPLAPASTATDLAYVIYTSGSTGNPKGVMVEHSSVVNRLAWMQRAYPIGPGEVILQKTSISFDVSVWELFWWSHTGATLALLEPGGEKDPAAIVDSVERHRVSTVHFVPSMLGMFLGHVDRFGAASRLVSLRRVFASGEALPPNHVARFAELLGGGGALLVNLYGPTEATVDVTHLPCEAATLGDAAPGELARVPIGRPIDNTRLYVLDAAGRPLPVGVPGELYIAGAGLARGYLGRPDLTGDSFVDGKAVGEQRLYRTGDRARWLPDGTLDYLGRVDLQVKVRGFRIEPAEIEERLRAHPAVADAAVVPREDGWHTALRAFVVPSNGAASNPASEPELKAHLLRTLPEYMVPGRIESLDALPLTPNGKLDRAALTRPRQRRRRAAPRHVEPRDDRERTLAAIWREVLGVPRVGVHDNFFALGGNSIHFVTVLAKAREAGLGFTFQQLFKHQTVAALAGELGAGSMDNSPPTMAPFELLTPQDRARAAGMAGVEDGYPLSLLQAGLIFQTEVTGGLGQYHDVLGYLIRGPFDADAFERAVRIMMRRHPILRTTYHLTGFGEFVQLVQRDVEPPMSIVDLRGRTPREQERFNDEWVAAEKARPFGWDHGALVSLHVQVLREDLYRYTVSQHNSALDGWSISLLHTELFDACTALREGRTPDAAPSTDNHLRNFVALERAAVASAQSRDFWLDVLRDAVPAEVPRRPEAEEPRAGSSISTGFEVVLHDVDLPAGITERVVGLADALSVPVKDVLLAAHVKVLSAVAGSRDVLTGYEHSGRPELPGAEAALGLFLNTVPLRIDVGEQECTWRDLIGRVYRAELDLLPHRRYPMARMKHDAGTRETLFETTFNYTHFYLMKRLRELPEFGLLDLRVDSETEFVFRTEFSRHFFDDDLRLCLHYHSRLFDAAQIERIGGYLVRVLELMTGEPDARHAATPLLAEADAALLAGGGDPAPAAYGNLVPQPVDAAAAAPSTVDRVSAVWAGVLGVPATELAAGSDFFALGGNSLSALRVVLELDGMITLTDLNRHPRLDDVARLLEQRQRPGRELLHLLSSTAAGARCALVCVPYPCGHPINFGQLAAALEELTSDVVVYGVEQPGHDLTNRGEFTPVAETARLVVAELADKADLPIVLWGHCGGAAVTIELARLLEERGHDLRHVFVGSKLLPTVHDMRESIEMIEGWTDERIIRFMVDETGYTDLDGLDGQHAEHMAAVFRHDVLGGLGYFVDASQRLDRKLAAPLTFVVAADDRGLAHYPQEYQRWRLLASQLRLHVLSGGGHYFVRTNPQETAELVERAWLEED